MKIKLPEITDNKYVFNLECPKCGKESTQSFIADCPPLHFLSECGCGHGVNYYPVDDPCFEIEIEAVENQEIQCLNFDMTKFLEWLSRNSDRIDSIILKSVGDISKTKIVFKKGE